jgi:cytochrome c-type biogenesis protein CcmH
MRGTRRLAVTAVALAALVLTPIASAAPTRASLMDIENNVMCVVCNEPLAVAESPQAYQERDFIRGLIAKGETKQQIERALVANYGIAVLGKPPARGFNLTVYVLPPAILVAGVVVLAFTLPRWRRRVRANANGGTAAEGPLSPADERRLDEELSRFPG